MMSSLQSKLFAVALACAAGTASLAAVAAPAGAAPSCASNANIWHVHSRLTDVIDQLSRDRHDYHGERVAAINALAGAREQLGAARGFAIAREGANPACFVPAARLDGPAFTSEVRGQYASDRLMFGVSRWLGGLIGQLSQDRHDYGGHRALAINEIRTGQAALREGDRFAHDHGY